MSAQESRPAWSPILPPETAERALRVVEGIAEDLRKVLAAPRPESPTWIRRGPSLAGGDAGQAFFFTYLDMVRPDRGYDDAAMELLERATDATGEMQAPPGLYSGFSGVAWVMEHLRGRLFEAEAGEDPGEEVASALVEHLGLTPWYGHYDLISGLVGFGAYALERLPRPGGREALEQVVARLAELADRVPGGIAWRTSPHLMLERELQEFPEGNFNVGVAHGVPGVIPLLAQACAAGVDARELLDGAVAWLLAQKLPAGASSIFPYTVAAGGEPRPTRLAWCYGDLGIAVSLLTAARAVGEAEWEREALEIAHRSRQREGEATGVIDAGLCHGAAGNAHLYNRLFQATGDPRFLESARHWFDRTLDFHHPGQGIGGYEAWIASGAGDDLSWQSDPGFLTGSAGVGLALLAAATPVAPEWDRVLMVNVPAKRED